MRQHKRQHKRVQRPSSKERSLVRVDQQEPEPIVRADGSIPEVVPLAEQDATAVHAGASIDLSNEEPDLSNEH